MLKTIIEIILVILVVIVIIGSYKLGERIGWNKGLNTYKEYMDKLRDALEKKEIALDLARSKIERLEIEKTTKSKCTSKEKMK